MDNTELIKPENEEQVNSEEVAKYIAEELPQEEETQQSATDTEEQTQEQPTPKAPPIIKKVDNGIEIKLKADTTYEVPAQEKAYKQIFVKVYDTEIPVTENDQAMYLKAILNDVPVELDVAMPNGFSVKCRSLNAYEADIAILAAQLYVTKYDVRLLEAALAPLQGCKAAMQLVSVNGRNRDYTVFNFTPGESDRTKDAEKLLNDMSILESRYSMPVYGLCMRALNTFEAKFNRLNELAYNGNFWLPGGLD